mmetsp:Transcript_21227/g.49206  ORF Transcript_21227/g.49206 Transcript_21227/m.49206 type:complete len:249 (-) Transcript_21227:404-1150(-)
MGRRHLALEAQGLCLELEGALSEGAGLVNGEHHGVEGLLGHAVAVQRAVKVVNLPPSLLRPPLVGLGPPPGDAVEARSGRLLVRRPSLVDSLPRVLPRLRVRVSEQRRRLGDTHLLPPNVALHRGCNRRVELVPARKAVHREGGDEVLFGQAQCLVLELARVLHREPLAGDLLDVGLGHAVGAQAESEGRRLRGLGEGRGEGADACHLPLGGVVRAVHRELAGAEGGCVGEEDDRLIELLGHRDEEFD